MPDGRVWTATLDFDFGHANPEPRIEILNPPYIGADRPGLGPVPATITLKQTFIVDVVGAKSIIRVAILRAASVTHSFSSDQRYVGLEFKASDSQLTITAPPAAAPMRQWVLGVPFALRFLFATNTGAMGEALRPRHRIAHPGESLRNDLF
jgi:hypothetical protein